jgi:hypothetical protein
VGFLNKTMWANIGASWARDSFCREFSLASEGNYKIEQQLKKMNLEVQILVIFYKSRRA